MCKEREKEVAKIEQYLPTIKKLARSLERKTLPWMDADDLTQVGAMKFEKIRDLYDESKGCFDAFAYWPIKGAMLDEIEKSYRPRRWRGQSRLELNEWVDGSLVDKKGDFNLRQIDVDDFVNSLMLSDIYGMRMNERLTSKEISKKMGVSEGRVSQILSADKKTRIKFERDFNNAQSASSIR